MKQYIPTFMEMPALGEVRELIDRSGTLKALGIVYGQLPKERVVLIREIKLDENGKVSCGSEN